MSPVSLAPCAASAYTWLWSRLVGRLGDGPDHVRDWRHCPNDVLVGPMSIRRRWAETIRFPRQTGLVQLGQVNGSRDSHSRFEKSTVNDPCLNDWSRPILVLLISNEIRLILLGRSSGKHEIEKGFMGTLQLFVHLDMLRMRQGDEDHMRNPHPLLSQLSINGIQQVALSITLKVSS